MWAQRSWRERWVAFVSFLIAFSACFARHPSLDALPRRPTIGLALSIADESTCANERSCGSLFVDLVDSDSPAARAGVRVGDRIIAVDGNSPVSASILRRAIAERRTVELRIRRNGSLLTLSISSSEAPIESALDVDLELSSIVIDHARLRTLITSPRSSARSSSKAPGVLMLQGYDCSSIDDANVPSVYRDLAHVWSAAGLVVMRVEKEGVGDSTGTPCRENSLGREIAGYRSALDSLLKHPRVDPARVYVWAHSMGAFVAPLVVRDRPIASITLVATTGQPWLVSFAREAARGGDANVSNDPFSRVVDRHLFGRTEAYFREVAAIDPASIWANVSSPVLIVRGTNDTVVDRDDARSLENILAQRSVGSVTLREIEGMDHALRRGGESVAPALIGATAW